MATSQDLDDGPAAVALIRLLRQYWYLVLPAVVIARFAYYRLASPLRKYPGPILASGSRALKVWSTWSGHSETDHIHLHQRYGPVVRIAPNELSFASPVAARQILAAGKGYHKTDFYGVFPPPENPDIFTETREDVHAIKKRHASHPYSMAVMQTMSEYIEGIETLLTRKLDEISQSKSRYCNIGDQLHYFAFDVLGQVAFSRVFGFLEAGCDVQGAIKTIDNSQWYNGLVGQIPEWDFVFRRNPLWRFVPGLRTDQFLITKMAMAALEERLSTDDPRQRKDLLSQLIAAHKKSPDTFTTGDVFAVAHGAIFAGSDSTASTMQSFFWHVLRDAEIYSNLKKEITNAARDGALSAMPQWNEAQALPYFQACLKEAMRLRPAVGLNITRLVPPQGADIDGNWIAGGTRVAVNAWVLHRDSRVFGTDAKIYRPERWMNGQDKEMERSMFQFGGGSHLCIGKNLALLEMNKVLPLLVRAYELELWDPSQALEHHSTFFVVQRGLEVRVSRRGKA